MFLNFFQFAIKSDECDCEILAHCQLIQIINDVVNNLDAVQPNKPIKAGHNGHNLLLVVAEQYFIENMQQFNKVLLLFELLLVLSKPILTVFRISYRQFFIR